MGNFSLARDVLSKTYEASLEVEGKKGKNTLETAELLLQAYIATQDDKAEELIDYLSEYGTTTSMTIQDKMERTKIGLKTREWMKGLDKKYKWDLEDIVLPT